jgi:predicted GNAT family acetyltransferase
VKEYFPVKEPMMVMSSTEEIRIQAAEAESRYELFVGGKPAGKLVYRDEGDTRIFLHTEVDPAYRGRGLASQLIEWSLDDVRASGKHLWVKCPAVSDYLARHPEHRVD